MNIVSRVTLVLVALSCMVLCGCSSLAPLDTKSLLIPKLLRSEIFGFLAGMGTTFAALPDLLAMLKRRSSDGMHPRIAAITGAFQVLWIYYGLLIASRPVIAWNLIGVCINFLTVATYFRFLRKGRTTHASY
jgi:MtN3 and saliva related transmembrane protein